MTSFDHQSVVRNSSGVVSNLLLSVNCFFTASDYSLFLLQSFFLSLSLIVNVKSPSVTSVYGKQCASQDVL
jgi:hypothetical protein